MHFFARVCGALLLTLSMAPGASADAPAPGKQESFDLAAFARHLDRLRGQRSLPRARYEAAQGRFAAAWIPRLLVGESAGDPFATWVLRDCDAMPDLPRANIDSSCSGEPDARERAAQRLQASSVGRDMAALKRLTDRLFYPSLIDGECGPDTRCSIVAVTKVMEEIERHMLATGILPGLPVRAFCPRAAADPSERALAEQCQIAAHRVLAMHTLARRFYRSSMEEAADDRMRMDAYPYATFDDIDIDGKPAKGGEANPEGLDFHGRFYGEVVHALDAMEAGIRQREAADPRWTVLLHSAAKGIERKEKGMPKASQPPRKKKEFWFAYENRMTKRFAGHYRGSLLSLASNSSITVLYPAAQSVRGRYLMFQGEGPQAKAEMGLLGPCTTRDPNELLCIWRDRAGSGSVSFAFKHNASVFKGHWTPFGSPADTFAHMDKRYWEELTTWDGTLQ